MLDYAIVILGVAVACAGWVWLQIWIQDRDPASRSIYERGCGGTGDCGKPECGGANCRSRAQ